MLASVSQTRFAGRCGSPEFGVPRRVLQRFLVAARPDDICPIFGQTRHRCIWRVLILAHNEASPAVVLSAEKIPDP